MYSRPDLDLLNFSFVRLFVCLCVDITSPIYELESDSSAHIPLPRCLRFSVVYTVASRSSFLTENLRQEQCIISVLSRGSIHQGHEGYSGQSQGKQCSFMSLSALLTAQSIPVIEWNSTTIDNVLVQGDNMYLKGGFLSLNNLPTVVCCRRVLLLFMSTNL